jgi:hypothetical protein
MGVKVIDPLYRRLDQLFLVIDRSLWKQPGRYFKNRHDHRVAPKSAAYTKMLGANLKQDRHG